MRAHPPLQQLMIEGFIVIALLLKKKAVVERPHFFADYGLYPFQVQGDLIFHQQDWWQQCRNKGKFGILRCEPLNALHFMVKNRHHQRALQQADAIRRRGLHLLQLQVIKIPFLVIQEKYHCDGNDANYRI